MSYAVSLFGLGSAVAPAAGARRGSFTIRVMHPSRTPVQRRPIVVVLKRNGMVIDRKPLPATGGRVVFSMPSEPGTYDYDVVETTTRKVLQSGSVNFYRSHLTQNKEKDVFLPEAIAYTRADRKRRRKSRRKARRTRRATRRAKRRGTAKSRGVSGLGNVENLSTIEKVGLVAFLGFGLWATFSR